MPRRYGVFVSTVRLVDAEQAPLLARPYYADGDPGPIVGALAQVPELLTAAVPFLSAVPGPSAIGWRTKEIVIVRTSVLQQCRYCVQTHTVVALDAGLSRAEVTALRGGGPADRVFADPAERVLLGWIDAVALGRGPVDEQTTAEMARRWADHEIVELTAVIGATLMLNRFATALELPTGAATLERLDAEGLR